MIFDQEKERIRRISSAAEGRDSVAEVAKLILARAQSSSIHDNNDDDGLTYLDLLRTNRSFRLYLLSYTLDHLGEWFTYVAAISLIEQFQAEMGVSSRTAISILVIVRIAPHVLFSTIGGAIADSRDKRIFMIQSALVGSVIALLYLLAHHTRSTIAVYMVMFLQEFNGALYEPNRTSIVPLMVDNDEMLKKATTAAGLTWSVVAAFGAGLGGFAVATFGTRACFVIDSVTFLASALAMWMVGGEWKAVDQDSHKYEGILDTLRGMIVEGFRYLANSFFGPLVVLKFSAAAVYGATDILNVAFSERDEDGGDPSIKLGMLFAVSGVGCVLGPLVAEPYNDMTRPASLQLVAVVSLAVGAVGCIGMGFFYPFISIVFFTWFRSAGNSVLWINSSLILQTLTSPEKLGRVFAIDYAMALFGEAASAFLSGVLMDRYSYDPEEVSLLIGIIGMIMTCFWAIYHWTGNGCARKDISTLLKKQREEGAESSGPDETTALLNKA